MASGGKLRLLLVISTLGASLLALTTFAGWTPAFLSFSKSSRTSVDEHNRAKASSSIGNLALQKVLDDAAPIFSVYSNQQTHTSTWMSAYPDETRIVHMNIPGAHDAATWNYSTITQASVKPITDLVNSTIEIDPTHYRCHDKPIIDMLNAGIRAFDLRYAYDITNSTVVFWHGPALQSQTATVEDVLFGFYQWLDDHPTEALFLSFQYEPAPRLGNVNSASEQSLLYQALTTPAAKQYILQKWDSFGTLGEARGKITLLKRFDLDLLHETSVPGVHFSPKQWTVNGANITLVYNPSAKPEVAKDTGTAYIQDYYHPLTPQNSSVKENVQQKLNATLTHLRMAASNEHIDSLFWSFASSTKTDNDPPVTPRMQALGNETAMSDGGVNQRLIPFLQSMRGKRLGIVMFDFFEEPDELVPELLSLLRP